eukprot:TRINITY_DN10090_c0_g1_i1.p1 TRINITY_DN10090_c0_g1~~TRINITY_DN10090_c0_g1_i1.p1  ORF type:complete len:291 (-),score=27.42 TRINITY_DN10090_c0_g1_i1:46-918(-)
MEEAPFIAHTSLLIKMESDMVYFICEPRIHSDSDPVYYQRCVCDKWSFFHCSLSYVLLAGYIFTFYFGFRLRFFNIKKFWQKLFFFYFFLTLFVRSLVFFFTPFFGMDITPDPEERIRQMDFVFLFTQSPTLFFFCSYIVLLFVWIEGLHPTKKRMLRILYLVLNVVIFVAGFPPLVGMVLSNQESLPSFIIWSSVLLVAGYCVIATGFAIVGIRYTFFKTRSHKIISKKVNITAAVVVFSFMIRGGLTITNIFDVPLTFLTSTFYFDFIYWTFLELIPLILMLVILDRF